MTRLDLQCKIDYSINKVRECENIKLKVFKIKI